MPATILMAIPLLSTVDGSQDKLIIILIGRNMMMKKLLTYSSTLILSTFIAQSALAVTWKLSHNQDKTHPVHKAMEYFAEKTKEYTDGNVKIRIYPNATLGNERESIELMNNGALQMVKVSAASMESFDPSFSIFSLPYIFTDREAYYKTLTGDIGERILQSPADKGFIGITFYDSGARSFYTNKKIETPDDLKGLKIRTMMSPTSIETVNLLGGVATPMPQGELYTAIQSKVVDGGENNPVVYANMRHFEVAKIYSLDEHAMIPDVLIVSKDAFDKINAEEQAAVKKAALESTLYMKETLWPEAEEESFKIVKESGVEVIKVNKAPFQEKVSPMYDDFKAKHPELVNDLDTILKN